MLLLAEHLDYLDEMGSAAILSCGRQARYASGLTSACANSGMASEAPTLRISALLRMSRVSGVCSESRSAEYPGYLTTT